MPTTNIETILDKLLTAIERLTPDTRPNTTFKRWRGGGRVEDAKAPHRERAIQFRAGRKLTPRTLSSFTTQWHRREWLLVVGYHFEEPQAGDALGLGPQRITIADQRKIVHTIWFSDALAGVSNVLKVQFNGADEPSDTAQIYHLDIEWGESTPT